MFQKVIRLYLPPTAVPPLPRWEGVELSLSFCQMGSFENFSGMDAECVASLLHSLSSVWACLYTATAQLQPCWDWSCYYPICSSQASRLPASHSCWSSWSTYICLLIPPHFLSILYLLHIYKRTLSQGYSTWFAQLPVNTKTPIIFIRCTVMDHILNLIYWGKHTFNIHEKVHLSIDSIDVRTFMA